MFLKESCLLVSITLCIPLPTKKANFVQLRAADRTLANLSGLQGKALVQRAHSLPDTMLIETQVTLIEDKDKHGEIRQFN